MTDPPLSDLCPPSSTQAGKGLPDLELLRATLNNSLLGKADVIELVLACVLARGHLLVEDLPGLGKTTLAKSLAQAIDGRFARLQCTPDLLPADITGFNVYHQHSRQFEFVEGPIFSDVLLVDEINRATPRTQSALFEAMAERQVTIDGKTRRLSDTFLVIATQNPVESHGTYPLPEAQLDRFAMKLRIGYPDRDSERTMLTLHSGEVQPAPALGPVLSLDQLGRWQEHIARIDVSPPVREYLLDLAHATRYHPDIALGVSPRGLLTWQRVAQAWACLDGRHFVTPDDIQQVALPVLEVRLTGNFDDPRRLVEELLASVQVPVVDAWQRKGGMRR